MLVRSDVSGVRSSWPASVTNRAWRSRDSARARNIVLKLMVSRASSSLPVTAIGRRSSVLATRSAASVSLATGRSPVPATMAPAAAATATPTPPTISSTQPSRRSTVSVGSSDLAMISVLPLSRRRASTRW
ncbi:Uncharacterised protein [Mycobacteroides abscessus subsp. abscessus]|nr:Uncharacterised protein [Mycobacteroides abscessus subsp. abscessus]